MFRNVLKQQLSKLTISRVLRVIVVGAVLGGLLFQGLSNASAAQIGLTFSHSGDKYIFSDQPETVPSTDKYTIEETLSSSYTYDIELYHLNSTGSVKTFGVVLYNNNSSSATITVYAKVSGHCIQGQSNHVDLTAPLERDYQNNVGATTLTLSAYSYVPLVWDFTPNGYTVNEKVKIKSSLSNVKVRVFHGPSTSGTPTSTYCQTVFGYSQDSADPYRLSQTTGLFAHDALSHSTSIDGSTYPSFVLSQWNFPNPQNSNEYETGTNVLGSSQLAGNYGMVYTVTITNPGNKRIRITPNWTTGNGFARIALWTSANGWYTTTKILPSNSWLMGTGTGATFTFKYVLPGGNFGNFKFEIID